MYVCMSAGKFLFFPQQQFWQTIFHGRKEKKTEKMLVFMEYVCMYVCEPKLTFVSNFFCFYAPSPKGACKKKRHFLGIFPKPPDPPPSFLLGNPVYKKKIVFILHFRPQGTFLVFTKKVNILTFTFGNRATPPQGQNSQNFPVTV